MSVHPLDAAAPEPDEVGIVLTWLAEQRGLDLRAYRRDTIARRVGLRLAATGSARVSDYLARLERDADEPARLLSTLVIPVTSFFRDPEVFEALERRVLPDLLERSSSRLVRTWVAGCATGEEAWSIAMLLHVACEARPGTAFRVLATDIDAGVLARARHAAYPYDAIERVPPALRARFFEASGHRAQVVDALRRRVDCAVHDLAGASLAPREAVLASFDLVMLRNVLIYFDRSLQEQVLERLVTVVEPGGALVLGPTENLPPSASARFAPYPGLPTRLNVFRREAPHDGPGARSGLTEAPEQADPERASGAAYSRDRSRGPSSGRGNES